MKKIISLLLSTLIFASVFISVPAFSANMITSGDYEYVLADDGTAVLRKYTGTDKDIVVPEEIDGHTVTGLDDTFYYIELNSLSIPKTVKNIVSDAMSFYGATKITVDKNNPYYKSIDNVVYTNDMTVIVKYASGKTDTTFTVPSTVKEIFDNCFYRTYNLENITLPDGLEKIDSFAFGYCTQIKDIKIPDTVKQILNTAFGDCTSLTTCTIPEGVTVLNSGVFENCDSLETVKLPVSLKTIDTNAFFLADGLKYITIPKNVSYISDNVFLSAEELTEIKVDKDNKYFTSYGGNLYSKDMKRLYTYCLGKKLKSFTIPNGVTVIGDDAFWWDENLEEIKIPNTVKEIEAGAFNHCSNLKSIKIPEGVKSLNFYTLNECYSLEKVYLPKTITEIRENFRYTKSLTDVYFAGSKAQWEKINFNGNNDTLKTAKIHFNSLYSTSITLPKYSGSVYVKGSYQLKPKVNNKYGTTTYKSANTKIAKVSSTGKITGVKAGKTTITVKNNGVSKKFTITVKKPKLNYTKKTIKVKSKFTIKVTGKVGTAKFSSSKKAIATVSKKGVVTAKKAGKTTITVTTNGMKLKCVVTVKKK